MPMAIEIRGFSEKVVRGRCSTLKFKTVEERKERKVGANMFNQILFLDFRSSALFSSIKKK